jgi:hypothetical protein
MRTLFAISVAAAAACSGNSTTVTKSYKVVGLDTSRGEIPVTVTFPKDWHDSVDHQGGTNVELTPPGAVAVMGALHIEVRDCRAEPPTAAACLDESMKPVWGGGENGAAPNVKREELGPGRAWMEWTGKVKDHDQGEVRLGIYDEVSHNVVECSAVLIRDDMMDSFKNAPAFRKVCETLKIAR